MSEIEELRQRLAAAERVCCLVGITAARIDGDREKALGQAWREWAHDYAASAAKLTDDEILTLAARQDIIRNRTLAKLHREAADGLEKECRASTLEARYEQQHEPEAFAAHVWGAWRTVPGHPAYEMRDCADEACRRVQTRHAPRLAEGTNP